MRREWGERGREGLYISSTTLNQLRLKFTTRFYDTAQLSCAFVGLTPCRAFWPAFACPRYEGREAKFTAELQVVEAELEAHRGAARKAGDARASVDRLAGALALKKARLAERLTVSRFPVLPTAVLVVVQRGRAHGLARLTSAPYGERTARGEELILVD